MFGIWELRPFWMVVVATCLLPTCLGQSYTAREDVKIRLRSVPETAVCGESKPENAVRAALQLVCHRDSLGTRNRAVEKAIIIGFVGGFVRSDDIKHPEAQFAAYLREAYPSAVHAEVFANHDGKHALRRVLQLLTENADGVFASRENKNSRITIYGHSWGASQEMPRESWQKSLES
jgi:hypothetical protein